MAVYIHPFYFNKFKRIFDILLSLILLILAAPLFLFIMIALWFTAKTPIIFIQKRLGLNKKSFSIYKFRTMVKNAQQLKTKYRKLNQAPNPMFKIYHDPRFIKWGRFLSKTGLDELPQLINILKGDMSIVGPRPLPVSESKKLKKNWDFRYQVRPGIVSLWTLSRERHSSLSKWRRLEIETLKQGGLLFEIKLLLKLFTQQFLVLLNK